MNEQNWVLRTSMASPFGRKIRMALAAISRRNEVRIVIADTTDPTDALHLQNPLGKIPILLVDKSLVLYDSRVIVDFIDSEDGNHILLPSGRERHVVLAQQALADGIMDAAILQMYEIRARPEGKRHDEWIQHQQRKIDGALNEFSEHLPWDGSGHPTIAALALAAAIGYLDFRFDGRWRSVHPKLVAWVDRFSDRFPAFDETSPR